jgi:hypothetical protein
LNDLNNESKSATLTNTVALKNETANVTKLEHGYLSSEWCLVWITLALAIITGALAFYTARLWKATKTMVDSAETTSQRQSNEMQASIAEAARSTSALKKIAKVTADNANLMKGVMHQQMRAYIAVEVGTATYQDRNLKFAANPVIVNSGYTPARNISFSTKAAILTIEDTPPQDLVIPENGAIIVNNTGLAPRQQFSIQGVVENRFSDAEVVEIMEGNKKRLFVWGTIKYEDVFGGHWVTNFCLNYLFYAGEDKNVKFLGYYHSSHNDAT